MAWDVFFIFYFLGMASWMAWGPLIGGKAAWLIWRYRETLEIKTGENISLEDLSKSISALTTNRKWDVDSRVVYHMFVYLPNGEYLEWTCDREGNPGTNGNERDRLQPIWVTHRRPTVTTEILKVKYSFMNNIHADRVKQFEDHRVAIWRMSRPLKWIIRKVSDEKLVLHKLSE